MIYIDNNNNFTVVVPEMLHQLTLPLSDEVICDWIWEKPAFMHNYKYLEIPILIICNSGRKQILAWNLPWFYSYLQSIYPPTIEWKTDWIAH